MCRERISQQPVRSTLTSTAPKEWQKVKTDYRISAPLAPSSLNRPLLPGSLPVTKDWPRPGVIWECPYSASKLSPTEPNFCVLGAVRC